MSSRPLYRCSVSSTVFSFSGLFWHELGDTRYFEDRMRELGKQGIVEVGDRHDYHETTIFRKKGHVRTTIHERPRNTQKECTAENPRMRSIRVLHVAGKHA